MIAASAGADIHFTTRGRGPACIVLSAIGVVPYERMLPSLLDEHLQLVFVDPRGSGESTGDPADLSFDQLADDIDAVRVALNLDRVAVFGHSIVGALALEYAVRRPEHVSHVITVGLPPHGDMGEVSSTAIALFEQEASAERKAALQSNLAAINESTTDGQAMLAYTPMRFYDPHFDAAHLFAGSSMKPAFLQHVFSTLVPEWRADVALPMLRAPLLLAQGRYDYASPAALWNDVLPSHLIATPHVFERSGHQPFVEEPEEFSRVLLNWMHS